MKDIDCAFIAGASEKELSDYIHGCELEFYQLLDATIERLSSGTIKIVSLAGPSCSGKTTCAEIISRMLRQLNISVTPISTDDYFKPSYMAPLNDDGTPNFEHFEHLEVDILLDTLKKIQNNEPFYKSHFDFKTGIRTSEKELYYPSENEIFVLEGIHALNDRIINELNKKKHTGLYISLYDGYYMDGKMLFSSRDVRFCRRLVRDFNHRGTSVDTTFHQWSNVIEGEELFIMPYIKNADITISSYLPYEIFALRNDAVSLLSKITPDSKYFVRASSITERLMPLPSIPKKLVPGSSILNEFLR